MANIKLNGQNNINNVTCFSYAPTILEVSSTNRGKETIVTLTANLFEGMDNNHEYFVKVNNTKLTAVRTMAEANGYKFMMNNTTSSTMKLAMLDSLVSALNRIPDVASQFDVRLDTYMASGTSNTAIKMIARHIGATTLSISSNIPFLSVVNVIGYADTEFKNGDVKVDVYKYPTPSKYNNSTIPLNPTFVTKLSKHVNNDSVVKFDLGSVFASMTDEGEAAEFGIYVYGASSSGLVEMATYNRIYNVNGYLINQGGEYLTPFENAKVAMNAHRGTTRNFLNNTILYIYESKLPISFYVASNVASIPYTLKYIGSNKAVIATESSSFSPTKPLVHEEITLNPTHLANSKYIDLELGLNLGTLRYDVIKPIRATDEHQRIYWYNSWGGVSFFEFTGNRTEERKLTTTTYQDSILDYYDNNINEKDYVYNKINEISVNLSTHNIHKDGQWALFDLQQSRTAWTWVNGEKYRVIIEDLTINETNVTDIYTATIRYKYSMGVNA